MQRITPAQAGNLPYICSSEPDGTMYEAAANLLDRAIAPAFFEDTNGRHYFETAKETKWN